MAHTHEHDGNTYYLEQIGTIGICGALGTVAMLLWEQDMLKVMLAPKFHLPVLLGGAALLILAGIRAVTLFIEARRSKASPQPVHEHEHDHDHDHGHEHHHDHAHEHEHKGAETEARQVPTEAGGHACGHHHEHEHECAGSHAHAGEAENDHGHEHGWSPWRYAILLLPVVLYCMSLPNKGFTSIKGADVEGLEGAQDVAGQSNRFNLQFKELEQAAYDPEKRKLYEGGTGIIKGQYAPSQNEKVFSLVRYKMTCCAADAIPLRVVILAPQRVENVKALDWIEVEGQIQFRMRERGGDKEVIPVLQLPSNDKIRKIPPDPDPYIQ